MQEQGYYKGRIRDWSIEKSRTGNWQIVLDLVVGSFAKDSISEEFQQINDLKRKSFLSLAPNMLQRTKGDLAYLGYPSGEKIDVTRLIPGRPNSVNLAQRGELIFECEHNEWEDKQTGKPRKNERWNLIRKADEPKREDIDQLNQLFEESEAVAPF